MSNKAAKLAKQQKMQQMAQKTKTRKPLAIVLGAATLIGGVAALLALLPRVTPTISDPVDPDEPFSSSVTITNTGYIPLNAVIPSIGMCQMEFADGPPPDLNLSCTYEHDWRLAKWVPHDLAIDDRFTFALNDVIESKGYARLQYADIAIKLQYEIPIVNVKGEKIFPMVARKQSNGRFYWYPKAMK